MPAESFPEDPVIAADEGMSAEMNGVPGNAMHAYSNGAEKPGLRLSWCPNGDLSVCVFVCYCDYCAPVYSCVEYIGGQHFSLSACGI